MHVRSTSKGFTLLETVIALLIGAIILSAIYAMNFQSNSASEKVDNFLVRIELAQALFSKHINCETTRSNSTCTNPIDLYDNEGQVVVAADGTTQINGLKILARCTNSELKVQYQKSDPTWHDVFPDSLPLCEVGP